MNVWNNSAAVVRNSVLSLIVVTLTTEPVLVFCEPLSVFELVDLFTLELEYTLGVVKPLEGFEPGAC